MAFGTDKPNSSEGCVRCEAGGMAVEMRGGIYIYIYIHIDMYIFFCVFSLVGKNEVKTCCTREFQGERHDQGWLVGFTSTICDGIFGEG